MKKNTGLMLFEIKGPLDNLLENLSGEHASYWLKSLKKLLRKEELPEPPPEVLETISKQNTHREKIREKVKSIAEYIRKIPVVHEVYILESNDDDLDLMNISVHSNTGSFLHNLETCDSSAFYLRTDGSVQVGALTTLIDGDVDSVCEEWYKKFNIKDTMTIKNLCTALIELGKMYEKTVLDIKI